MAEVDKLNIDSIIARLLEGKYEYKLKVNLGCFQFNGVCRIRLVH